MTNDSPIIIIWLSTLFLGASCVILKCYSIFQRNSSKLFINRIAHLRPHCLSMSHMGDTRSQLFKASLAYTISLRHKFVKQISAKVTNTLLFFVEKM